MVRILGFDTCLDKMYVALSDNEKQFSKVVESTDTHYHSAFLISTIKEILKEANLTPSDIQYIAVNSGPGSFTGIRACNTVARVFAQAKNLPIVSISSLEILSHLSEAQKVIVALDARKNMAYTAIYENGTEKMAPQAILLEDVLKLIDCEVITDDRLKETLGGKSYMEIDADLGKILINTAKDKISKNLQIDWRSLKPLYIQPPPVTLKK